MLERLLAHVSIASDALQVACYYLAEKTNSKGAFISTRTLDYFDVVVGSLREKRIGNVNSDHINMLDINTVAGSPLANIKGVLFIKTNYGWYVGLDTPIKDLKNKIPYDADELSEFVNNAIAITYPVFAYCVRQEDKPNVFVDFLTGTLTRAAFFQDIKSFIQTVKARKELPLWLFYMDFNNFKAVNDSLGHDMGDQVLASIAMEIRTIFAGYGSVYRLGGDEFTGLCLGVEEDIVNRIKKRIESVTRQAPCGLFVNVAVSVEKFSYEENLDIEKAADLFLQKSESSMYVSKYHSHNRKINTIDCNKCKYANSIKNIIEEESQNE
ncbi:MAG: GGDEF domain-containing protein [Candidatus Parvarchaeum sp.]